MLMHISGLLITLFQNEIPRNCLIFYRLEPPDSATST